MKPKALFKRSFKYIFPILVACICFVLTDLLRLSFIEYRFIIAFSGGGLTMWIVYVIINWSNMFGKNEDER